MLDWFTQSRMSGEREDEAPQAPCLGQILRDYTFHKRDGMYLTLSQALLQTGAPQSLVLLPRASDTAQAYFLESLRTKFADVRREQTRVLVVTRPEYLSTVVVLGGDLLIVADETGDAMLELDPLELPVIYLIGPGREVLNSDSGGQLAAPGLRSAA